MKIYFAGAVNPYSQAVVKYGGQSLLSYADPKSIEKYWSWHPDKRIFLDSGAYTASTLGKVINIDEYMAFIKANHNRIETYATLDVIGDWKKTVENTEYMESKGFRPLPVFHYKSPEAELKRLCDKYDYIGLGGLVPIAKDKKTLRKWLDYCFSIIGTTTKVHGLGMTAQWCLERYPFYTTDSTSYLQSSRFGSSKIINDERIIRFNNKTKHYLERTEIEVKATIELQNRVTKLWEKRGIIWED